MPFKNNFFDYYNNVDITELVIEEADYESLTIDDVKTLCTQLLELSNIKTLKIINIEDLEDTHVIELVSHLPKLKLTALILDLNKISDISIEALAKALAHHETLITLSLGECDVTAVGAKYLADMLLTNTVLEEIDLTPSNYCEEALNQINNEGAYALYDASLYNETLLRLTISEENNISDPDIIDKINTCLSVNKQRQDIQEKPVSYLSSCLFRQLWFFQSNVASDYVDNKPKLDDVTIIYTDNQDFDERPKKRRRI